MRFLLGGRHGEFKFLPPPGYAPCHEAVLPRERLHLEPIKEYRREGPRGPHLVGPSRCLSHTDFVPCPVDTVQVLNAHLVMQVVIGVKQVGAELEPGNFDVCEMGRLRHRAGTGLSQVSLRSSACSGLQKGLLAVAPQSRKARPREVMQPVQVAQVV